MIFRMENLAANLHHLVGYGYDVYLVFYHRNLK